jgi:hypothetical protein
MFPESWKCSRLSTGTDGVTNGLPVELTPPIDLIETIDLINDLAPGRLCPAPPLIGPGGTTP